VKYAKYKAVEIVKAIKSGAKMVSGPPEVGCNILTSPDISNLNPVTTNSTTVETVIFNDNSLDKTESAKSNDSPKHTVFNTPIITPVKNNIQALSQPAYSTVSTTKEVDYNEENAKVVVQAGKHAKYAQSALMYDDIKTAVDNLEKALALLKPLNQ
jgi:vacuolar protein sorting-associated protein VTA1